MSNRKEELLSKLRSTLAIMSQATKFDPVVSGDTGSQQPSTNQTSTDSGLNYSSVYTSFQGHTAPSFGTSNVQSSGVNKNLMSNDSRKDARNVATKLAPVQYKALSISGIASLGNIDDVDDEDEFLYGSSDKQEPAKTSEADVLFSYLPEESPKQSTSSTHAFLSGYFQQTSGLGGNHGPNFSELCSGLPRNVLKSASKPNPDVHCEASKYKSPWTDPVLAGNSRSHPVSSCLQPNPVQYGVEEEENLNASAGTSWSNTALQASKFWTDRKMTTASFRNEDPPVQKATAPVQLPKQTALPMCEKNSNLSATVDKILQTINLDSDLRKLMEAKFKKEDESTVKEVEMKKTKLEINREKLEEEIARREKEKLEQEQIEEQNRLFAEKLIKDLIKVRDGKEAAGKRANVINIFADDAEIDLEASSSVQSVHSVRMGEELLANSMSVEKKFPVSSAPHPTFVGKCDSTENRLMVTSGGLLKPETDSSKPKSRSGMDSAWEQSTEEFLRKLNSREGNKAEGKRMKNLHEDFGRSRFSRERGRVHDDNRSERISMSSESDSDSSRGDRVSGERKIVKMAEKSGTRYSKSLETRKDTAREFSISQQQQHPVKSELSSTNTVSVGRLFNDEDAETTLTTYMENKQVKTREEMKADIKALQEKLANLQQINSGLLMNASNEARHLNVGNEEMADAGPKLGEESSTPCAEQQFITTSNPVSKTKLTIDHVKKLEASKMEMQSNFSALQLELENLQRLSSGLLQRPASKQRDAMLEENRKMQSVVEDQLWALHRTTKELSEELRQENKNWEYVTQNAKIVVPTTSSTGLIVSDSKDSQVAADLQNTSTSVSFTVDLSTSVSASQSMVLPPAVVDSLASTTGSLKRSFSTSKEQSLLIKETEKSISCESKKSIKQKSSSRSSSSSSSSSSTSSSSDSSNNNSRRSRSRSRRRSKEKTKDLWSKYSYNRTEYRKRSWEGYRNEGIARSNKNRWYGSSYHYEKRPYRHCRSRSRSPGIVHHSDRIRSSWCSKSKSPATKRGRKSRSRSKLVSAKKREGLIKTNQSLELKKSKEAERENIAETEASVSKVLNETEPELRKGASVEEDQIKTVDPEKVEGASKDTCTKPVEQCSTSMEKILDDKKKRALDWAMNMYAKAEDYYDGGNTWCRKCDLVFSDMSCLCRHLHSDQHQLTLDPNYDKPTPSTEPKQPIQTGILCAPARGDEFLMPLQAFFCSLCCEFSKDNVHAESHLKSHSHNNKFKQFLKENPSYEFQYLMDKMNALMRSRQNEKIAEIIKRPASTEAVPELEVKRIKILPFTPQESKPSGHTSSEKIQIKVVSGSLSKVITHQARSASVTKTEEKRIVSVDKRPSASTALHRNPSPLSSVVSAKAGIQPSGGQLESSKLPVGSHLKQQVPTEVGTDPAASLSVRKMKFDVWESPNQVRAPKSEETSSPLKLPAKPEMKNTNVEASKQDNRLCIAAKSSAAESSGSRLKFQMFKGKKISKGRGQQVDLLADKKVNTSEPGQLATSSSRSGLQKAVKGSAKPSFKISDFEVFDECD